MDTQAVNPAGNPTAPKSRPSSSRSRSEASPAPDVKSSGDTVDLSSQGRALVQTDEGGQTSPNSEQKKFSVTDDNDVVVQVVDKETQKVVKSIPSEEELQLKSAIRDGVSEIIE